MPNFVEVTQEEFYRVIGPMDVGVSATKSGCDYRDKYFHIHGRTERDPKDQEIVKFLLREDHVRKATA